MANQYQAGRKQWDRSRIRALRRHLGLTQQEMADRLGTRQQTISEWEIGLYTPRGASATLLSMVAERAAFKYDARPSVEKTKFTERADIQYDAGTLVKKIKKNQ